MGTFGNEEVRARTNGQSRFRVIARTYPPLALTGEYLPQAVLEWSTAVGCSRRQEEASGQEIELGPAEHLAFEHLQAVDLAFDGALTPR